MGSDDHQPNTDVELDSVSRLRAESCPAQPSPVLSHRRQPSETWIGSGTPRSGTPRLGATAPTARTSGHVRNQSDGSEGENGERYIGEGPAIVLIGGRTALRGEEIISQIDDALQLTNYRVILCQSTEYCVKAGAGIAIDAWIKDVSCIEVVKERFNPILLSIGLLLILGGVVNYEDLGLHVSNDFQIGINMAPIGFYLIGLAVLIVAQCLRRTCLSLGVLGQVDKTSFQVRIKQSDVFMVNQIADRMRRIQAPYSILQ